MSYQDDHSRTQMSGVDTLTAREVMRTVMHEDSSSHSSDSDSTSSWRKRLKLVIPHVTLVLATALYMLLGAFVFYYIERPNEERVKTSHRDRVWSLREQLMEEAWKMGDAVDEAEFMDRVGTTLDDIINETLHSFAQGVTADALNKETPLRMQWTYPSAIFFSTTVITTIGYGHLVPVTLWGRVICIVYALLGIPLALVTTADLGKFVSMALTSMYEKYHRFKEDKICPKKGVQHMLAQMHGGIVPRREEDKKTVEEKLDIGELYKDKTKDEDDKTPEEEDIDEAPVPPSLLLFLLLGYTAASAWLFTQWEGWNFLQSFYFCFITMITVGFGDLFPTKQAYLFPAILFIFTGLILTTMCIDLVGTHYIRRIHNFGRKIQSAKDAFAALGMPEWLKQRGISESHLRQMLLQPDEFSRMLKRNAFIPSDLEFIKFIDQKLSSNDEDASLLSSLTMSSRVFKPREDRLC